MDEIQRQRVLELDRFRRRLSAGNDAVPTPSRANVNHVRTYEELVGGIADFLRSAEHKLLRTVLAAEDESWMVGVPSAVRRAMESVGRAGLGTLIWVQLTYHDLGRSLREVQRKVAEQVLGVEATKQLMDPVDEDDDYGGVKLSGRGILEGVSVKISEELSRLGRFLLVIQDWREADSPELGNLGIPLPNKFHINISPSLKRAKREDNRNDLTRRAPFRYQRIQVLHPNILSKQSPLSRHIEIQGSHPSTTDMHGLLKNTLSLSINNQHSYTCLSELMPTGSVVKQCQIEECHELKSIFDSSASSCQFQYLESLWASQLGTLLALAAENGRRNFNWSQGFKNLKHIHLEFCPRLSYVFPPGAQQGLESLEILEICFCTDLKEVFASPSQEPDGAMPSSSSYPPPFAPHLRIVHLLELPSLVSLCPEACKDWPALEKFKVRGCRRLKKLPFLFYSENTSVTTSSSSSSPSRGIVMIDGEPAWWNRVLRGNDISTKHQFHFTGVDLPLLMPKK